MSWLSQGIRKLRKGAIGRFFDEHTDDVGTAVGFAAGALVGQPALGAAAGRTLGAHIGPEHRGEKGKLGFMLKQAGTGYALGTAGDLMGADSLVRSGASKIGIGGGRGAALQRAVESTPAPGVRDIPPMARASVRDVAPIGNGSGAAGSLTAAPAPISRSASSVLPHVGSTPAAAASSASTAPAGTGYGMRLRNLATSAGKTLTNENLLTGAGLALNAYGGIANARVQDRMLDYEMKIAERERQQRDAIRRRLSPYVEQMLNEAFAPRTA